MSYEWMHGWVGDAAYSTLRLPVLTVDNFIPRLGQPGGDDTRIDLLDLGRVERIAQVLGEVVRQLVRPYRSGDSGPDGAPHLRPQREVGGCYRHVLVGHTGLDGDLGGDDGAAAAD